MPRCDSLPRIFWPKACLEHKGAAPTLLCPARCFFRALGRPPVLLVLKDRDFANCRGSSSSPPQLHAPPSPIAQCLAGLCPTSLPFLPFPVQLTKMSTSDKERPPQLLFVKALASRGRIEAIAQQMGYHPHYLDSFLRLQHYLLHMDGPLPFDCRHFIAIMVRARPESPAPRGLGAHPGEQQEPRQSLLGLGG